MAASSEQLHNLSLGGFTGVNFSFESWWHKKQLRLATGEVKTDKQSQVQCPKYGRRTVSLAPPSKRTMGIAGAADIDGKPKG
jgi:hypothetical protein